MEFIREFAVGGELMRGKGLTAADRSERIRVAIYTHHLVNAPFRDTGMTYAQAFQRCYGRPIEMRRKPRDAYNRPVSVSDPYDKSGPDEDEDSL